MKDELGDRMKTYEMAYDYILPQNLPVILRLDGKGFSKFTWNRFEVPFDENFKQSMYISAKALLSEFSGGQIGYIQSDEITLLFRNDLTEEMNPFYNNRVQKICSIAASICAVTFYKTTQRLLGLTTDELPSIGFDCRCFVMSYKEVINNFIWRQSDAIRNAINSILYWKLRKVGKMGGKKADSLLTGMSSDQKLEYLRKQFNVELRDYPLHYIRGACITRKLKRVPIEEVLEPEVYEKLIKTGRITKGQIVERNPWMIDYEIPLFRENREYITRFTE